MKAASVFALVCLSAAGLGAGAGCSSSNATTADGAAGNIGAGGAGGGSGSLHGLVSVVLKEEEGYTDFSATFRDGPFPPPPDRGALEATMTMGGCELLVPVGCDPACPSTSWCTGRNQCTPKSTVINAGTLTVTGLDGRTLTLEPMSNSYVVNPTLPLPACGEGANVTVTAADFTVTSRCSVPLHVTSSEPVRATAGNPIVLAWTPPAQPGLSRIKVIVEIAHHGGYKGEIDCDVEDTGAFSVPEPLVTALNGLGRAGYPTVELTRLSTATAPTRPKVSLSFVSLVTLEADTGVISCMDDAECPPPMTCRQDGRLCQ